MILLVNFGGPRTLAEVAPFLEELLTDQDVVRTTWPAWFHRLFFRNVARRRAVRTRQDYAEMGGGSPIYADTEAVAALLEQRLRRPVLTLHRYLPMTHPALLERLRTIQEEIVVLPLFPQFCYATTGSIARFLYTRGPEGIATRLRWIRSYADHPAFLRAHQLRLRRFLEEKGLQEQETLLLFSAHGIPVSFQGESYPQECERSFRGVMAAFPRAIGRLSFQSRVGPGEWIRPYTEEVCRALATWSEGRRELVVVPISFTSDHVETLVEIEREYLPLVRACGVGAHRCPALNRDETWIQALQEIVQEERLLATTEELIRGRST